MKQFTKAELSEMMLSGVDNLLAMINERMNEPEVIPKPIDYKARVYPKYGTKYWYIETYMVQSTWCGASSDTTRFNTGNYFETKEKAQIEFDWQALNGEILNTIARLNKDHNWVADWKDIRHTKYAICLDHGTNTFIDGIYNCIQSRDTNHYLSAIGKDKLLTLYTHNELKFWLTKEKA